MTIGSAVSALFCTRNRSEALAKALSTWHPVLEASRTGWELLIVDNASDVDLRSVVEDAPVPARYIHCARIGLGAARDNGWRHARGRIVAFTDDDCYPAPDFVDRVAEVFAEHPDTGCLGGRILLHNPDHAHVTIKESDTVETFAPCRYLKPAAIHGANMAIPRRILEEVGGLDPELGAGTPFPCEDIDVITAVLWAGHPARYDPRPTVRHDHGRSEADRPALMRSYDRGRGAHYAKYAARQDTRRAFLSAWWQRRRDTRWRSELPHVHQEAASALSYLAQKRHIAALCLVGPAIGLALGVIHAKVTLHHLRHRLVSQRA